MCYLILMCFKISLQKQNNNQYQYILMQRRKDYNNSTKNNQQQGLPQRRQYEYQQIGANQNSLQTQRNQDSNNYSNNDQNQQTRRQQNKRPHRNQRKNNNKPIPNDRGQERGFMRQETIPQYQFIERKNNRYRELNQIGKQMRNNHEADDTQFQNRSFQAQDQREQNQDIKYRFNQLFWPFDEEDLQMNRIRRISLVREYGTSDERLMKRVLKRHLSKNIKKIDGIFLLIDPMFPRIEVECLTDLGKQEGIQLLQMFRTIQKQEVLQAQLKRLSRTLFYSHYSQVDPKELNTYLPVLNEKIKDLGMTSCDFYVRRDKQVKNILSCYCIYKDQFNFVALDHNWNDVHFNHVYIQVNKSKFKNVYQIYKAETKGYLQSQKKGLNEDNDFGGMMGNEELSSDQQKTVVQYNMVEINQKLNLLFQQTLQNFQDQIQAKQQEQQRLRDSNDNNRDEQLEKVMEQVYELNKNLESYQQKRKIFKQEYDSLNRQSQRIVQIYKQLRMLKNQLGSKLPIISRKKELFEQLDKNNIIILEGETGSGKSTQLPQMLCEYYKVFNEKSSKAILLSQPRKLSTRTLAERIASQLDQKVHGFVDYVSSGGKQPQKQSKIVVMLDRLILDQLQKDPLLNKYHCLILDEAHERTLSIDILIGLLRDLIKKRPQFKVIVTSATLDAILFEKYFSSKTFKVSGRMFPVQIIYRPFDNLNSTVEKVRKILNQEVLKGQNRNKYRGHILVFCTTVDQINTLCNQYSNHVGVRPLPLHGKLTSEQQKLIFQPEQHMTKLIFTSRIAETAVTIDKVKVVIDTGEDRQTVYDQKKKITAFELKPISKSAAKQRAGRAGRTGPGFCFRLYSNQFQQKNMTNNKIPQLKSVPLDTLVLRLKQLKIPDILNFRYIQSPESEALKQSQDRMQIIGCLDQYYDITEVGLLLVKIPIEPFLSRALAEGLIIDMKKPKRKILPQLLKTLVMIVNGQSIFYSKYGDAQQRQMLERLKFQQFADKQGDFFSLLRVYEDFQYQKKNRNIHKWCKQKFLNKKVLTQASQLFKEVKQLIDNVKINTQNCKQFEEEVLQKQKSFNTNKELILACILPSFCQQLALYSGNSKIGYTSIKRQTPLQIYGTSFLTLQGINPKWIISFDVFKTSNMFCRLGQQVSFDMLKKAIPARLYKRYKIQECQKSNPFYQALNVNLPTVLFQSLKKRYQSNDSKQLQFLNQSKVLFYYELNLVEIYINKKDFQFVDKNFNDLIFKMRKQIQSNYNSYTHHYLGSVTAILSSGCQPKLLNFSNYLYAMKMYGLSNNLIYTIQLVYTLNVVKVQCNYRSFIIYFSEQEHRKCFKKWYDQFKNMNPGQFKNVTVKIEKGFEERRDKIATVKIKIRFFIGQKRDKNNFLLMGYKKDEADAFRMFMMENDEDGVIQRILIKPKADRPTVTAFVNKSQYQMDEVDFGEYLEKIMRNNFAWRKPSVIKGFRDICTELANKTEQQWAEEIKDILPEVDLEDINIRGYGRPGSQFWTQVNADVRMYDTVAAQRFKKLYDKQRDILGNQKMHVQIRYSQTLIRIPKRIFKIFQKKFNNKKFQMQAQFTRIIIQSRQSRTRNGDFVNVQSSSTHREDLIRPAVVFKQIFKAQSISLDPLQLRILNKKIGYVDNRQQYLSDKIFDEICYQLEGVQFEIMRKGTFVKVYSTSHNLKKIELILKDKVKQYNNLMMMISYRGKNVHEVNKIINRYANDHDIKSQFIFSTKMVELIGNIDVLKEIQNQIAKLVEKGKGNCPICYDIITSPHSLFNCQHTFCKYCLISSIRSVSDDASKFPLICPGQQCNQYINIYDLKNLFDPDQFDRMCDISVQKMIDDKKYHGCLTPDCQMIFQVEQSKKKKSFNCHLCTIHYCYQCREIYHDGQTCQEYKISKNSDQTQQFKKMGLKQCRKCKAFVQKNQGCNHISCKCGAHFCWKCEQVFDTAKECYDHLAKQCGGIFDAVYPEGNVQFMRMERRGVNQRNL